MVNISIKRATAAAITLIALCLITACGSKKQVTTASYHALPTECLGAKGSEVILKVSAFGFSMKDAIENAKIKAIEEITFTGIHAGDASACAYPIVDDPTARTRHQAFFNKFLSSKGSYGTYARAEKPKTVEKFDGEDRMMCIVTVIVDKDRLRKYYQNEKIIPKK